MEAPAETLHVEAHEEEPSIEADKLSYEIFSILESKFLFGYDDHKLWVPRPSLPPPAPEAASPVRTQRGKVCVLCIDGGGLRGVLPGKALAHLEQALQSRSGDPDARISDFFDVGAGTGVGGVFAAMLFATRDGARPLFRADDTWRFVVDNAERLFRKPASSRSALLFCRRGKKRPLSAPTLAMEEALKEAFGVRLTLRDTLKPVLIPCYDLKTSAPLVFSRADALESASFDFRLWEVCRATWAEPGRFEPAEVRSADGSTTCVAVDGGLATGNPTSTAITHVLHNKQEFPFVRGVEDLLVLSLGCGGGAAAVPASSGDDCRRLRRWGLKEWARPVARITSDGAADVVDQAVALAFGQCHSSNYVRVQANGSSVMRCGLDSDCHPSPPNVAALTAAAEEMLKQKNVESVLLGGKRMGEQTNMERLEWFAGELVAEQRTRSRRIAPTVVFKQAPPRPA